MVHRTCGDCGGCGEGGKINFKLSAFIFLLPVLLFFAGYFVGEIFGLGLLFAAVFLLISFIAAVIVDRRSSGP